MYYEEVNTNEEIITPDQLIEFANHWTQADANIISGCCGLGPDHTQALCNLK
jgi:S-methylmethionine-dependent homocysteine/selenocysteine methylase|tara:strand:- start:732 stop:887 length:156 start_codon:yes stop_codon:yes gene_type:complete